MIPPLCRAGLATALGFALAACAACTPALNWREVRPASGLWVAQLPCKPTEVTRAVDLAGGKPEMTMWACATEGVTFAVAQVDVGDPAKVPAVLALLKTSAGERLGERQVLQADADWPVPGQTPQPDAGRWRGKGLTPDGRRLEVECGVASRGTLVVQVTAMGEQLTAKAREPLFAALRFTP